MNCSKFRDSYYRLKLCAGGALGTTERWYDKHATRDEWVKSRKQEILDAQRKLRLLRPTMVRLKVAGDDELREIGWQRLEPENVSVEDRRALMMGERRADLLTTGDILNILGLGYYTEVSDDDIQERIEFAREGGILTDLDDDLLSRLEGTLIAG